MNLLQKWLLAFGVVILIAVSAVALIAGYSSETALRRYATLYSGRTSTMAQALIAYYEESGGWTGLQQVLPELVFPMRGRGRGNIEAPMEQALSYRVANAERTVVANTSGQPGGKLSQSETAAAMPLTLGDTTIGYLVLDEHPGMIQTLDEPAAAYLARLRWALVLGGSAAAIRRIRHCWPLTHSIVSPVQSLAAPLKSPHRGRSAPRRYPQPESRRSHRLATTQPDGEQSRTGEAARRAQTAPAYPL